MYIETEGGVDMLEKKSITLNRQKLYEDIWERSVSKVAKENDIPFGKLKAACKDADIPLPTASYWGNKGIGKEVTIPELPASETNEITIQFSKRQDITIQKTEEKTIKESPTEENTIPENTEETCLQSEVHEKSAFGTNIYKREQLYNEVWNEPVIKVAKKYGVSDVMIHKVCKSLNIPVPPRGYWAKKQAGQKVEITPLPQENRKDTIIGTKKEPSDIEKNVNINLDFLDDTTRSLLLKTASELKIQGDAKKLHRVLAQHKIAYKAWKVNHHRDEYANWKDRSLRNIPENEPEFWESVSEQTLPRLYLILDALFCAIEVLGGSVNDNFTVCVRGETVSFSVIETKRQVPHVLTKEEQKAWDKYDIEKQRWSFASKPQTRKYDYIATGKLRISICGNEYFKDTDNQCLETRLGEMLIDIFRESENVRIIREKREAEIRKKEEEKRQKELYRQMYNEEVARTNALKNEAEDYAIACNIRKYISALEEKENLSEKEIEYINWAKQKADWFDPTIAFEDPFLGKREHQKDKEDKELKPYKSSFWW